MGEEDTAGGVLAPVDVQVLDEALRTSGFQSFKISQFHSFELSKFQTFKVSALRTSGVSRCAGHMSIIFKLSKSQIFKRNVSLKTCGFFLGLFEVPWCLQR